MAKSDAVDVKRLVKVQELCIHALRANSMDRVEAIRWLERDMCRHARTISSGKTDDPGQVKWNKDMILVSEAIHYLTMNPTWDMVVRHDLVK